MNKRQRSRLQRLEAAHGEGYGQYQVPDYEECARQAVAYFAGDGPRPADPPCPPGEDHDFWAGRIRSKRIQDRRMLEMFGHEERAAGILIDPPATTDELRWADEFLDEIRQAAERVIAERDQ